MTMTPLQEIGDEIHDLSENLDTLNAKVARMSAAEKESPAGHAGMSEKDRLQRQLDRLYAEQDRLLADQPDAADMMPLPGHPVPEFFMA